MTECVQYRPKPAQAVGYAPSVRPGGATPRAGDRQPNRKRGATPVVCLEIDRPVVGLDDLLDDGKARPVPDVPRVLVLDAKNSERSGGFLVGDPDAAVLKPDDAHRVGRLDGDCERPPGGYT